jgi:hypothetical protein
MNILKTKITQIVLVHDDDIPFLKLTHQENLDSLLKRYRFNSVEHGQDQTGKIVAVVCSNGIYAPNGEEIAIEKLNIENRKFILVMEGNSVDAGNFYEDIANFLISLGTGKTSEFLTPLLVSNESEIVAHLNFSVRELLPQKLQGFVFESMAKEAGSEFACATVKIQNIEFVVDYIPNSSVLTDYRITLSRKELIIRPARSYPLEEQIYYLKAPLDTESHMRFIEELEKVMS